MSLQDDIARYLYVRDEATNAPENIAAGLERDYYLVKLADLPEVTYHRGPDGPHMLCGHMWVTEGKSAEECEQRANEYAAIAVAKRARESEAAVLARRRGQLASVYGTHINLAIDDLIKEQDARAAAEAEVARLKGERG